MRKRLSPEDLKDESKFELLTEVSHQKLREFVVAQITEEKHIIRTYSIYQVVMILIFTFLLTRGIVLSIKGHSETMISIVLAVVFSFSALIVIHELLHALAYLLTGARRISFGIIPRKFIFYALADRQVIAKRAFHIVALTPFIVVKLICLIGIIQFYNEQIMMDDIIDLELEKINGIIAKIDSDPEDPEIKNIERSMWLKIQTKAKEGRRTGVGITAEGDMLAALGLRYGSDDATDFSEEIHKTVALEAYRSSVNMAKERGAFKIYSADREKNNPMIKRLRNADEQLYQDMVKYGRRNIALLTIAPTGTTSLMTQTTSGIEPVFMPVYKRRRKVNPGDKNVKVDFVDEVGDSWEEYVVFHHKFKDWMTINGFELKKNYPQEDLDALIAKSPYYKSTSNDVDWMNKVRMQGKIQKWVDHSISVTINLPADADEELVGQLYFEAWKSGCKGVTVYRDGSRSGVLISNKKEEVVEEPTNSIFPTKRPIELEADVVRFQNAKDKWVAFIGTIDGRPYEIFTGLSDDEDGILLPRSVVSGKIIKNINPDGTKRYDFQYTNKQGYRTTIEGLSYKFNPVFWNYAKLISGVLRHGMPIHKVVNTVTSLQFDNDTINSWKAGVARALKKYVPDGTVAEGAICGECGSKNVVYQEGCLICPDCGTSKCG